MSMRVLAIDPGYDRLGMAVLEKRGGKEAVLFSECVTTSKESPRAERLFDISEAVRAAARRFHPDALAIETLFLHTNQKTAMAVAEARGAILASAAREGLRVFEYAPLQIKIAVTGYGRSDKRQVAEMVKKLVRLEGKKRLDDEYDAIAVGLTCLASAAREHSSPARKP